MKTADKKSLKQAIIDLYIDRSAQFGRINDAFDICRKSGITSDCTASKREIRDGDGNLICYAERRYSARKINLCYKELKPKWVWVWEGYAA